ncbi:hypothetical protein TrVE_jg2302 [Triparma verrucosa]|uniref:Uncharacterized protein n=1 Tax=Triparma verrucosa TaxID=1606542 RepID=A0A9W7KVV2_9STRA|nr:hypothetical protein TrVE_jg2302 [Triparma verrucosa]
MLSANLVLDIRTSGAKIEEMKNQHKWDDIVDEYWSMGYGLIFSVMLAITSCRMLGFFARRFSDSRRAFNELGEEAVESFKLLPFYSTFSSSFVPSSFDFEVVLLKRKWAMFYLSRLVYMANFILMYMYNVAQTLYSKAEYHYSGDPEGKSAYLNDDNKKWVLDFATEVYRPKSRRVGTTALECCTLLVILTWFLRPLSKRPYLSAGGAVKNDPRNSTEVLIMRCSVYAAIIALVMTVIKDLEFSPFVTMWTINVSCGALLILLIAPQYKLIVSFIGEMWECAALNMPTLKNSISAAKSMALPNKAKGEEAPAQEHKIRTVGDLVIRVRIRQKFVTLLRKKRALQTERLRLIDEMLEQNKITELWKIQQKYVDLDLFTAEAERWLAKDSIGNGDTSSRTSFYAKKFIRSIVLFLVMPTLFGFFSFGALFLSVHFYLTKYIYILITAILLVNFELSVRVTMKHGAYRLPLFEFILKRCTGRSHYEAEQGNVGDGSGDADGDGVKDLPSRHSDAGVEMNPIHHDDEGSDDEDVEDEGFDEEGERLEEGVVVVVKNEINL